MSLLALFVPSIGSTLELTLANSRSYYLPPLVGFWALSPAGGNPILGLLTLVISFFAGCVYFAKLEQELCTLRFAAWTIMSTACVGVGHLLMMAAAVRVLGPAWYFMPCVGLWPLLVIAITRRFLAEPAEATQSIWGVIEVRARWYPLALIALFSLFSMRVLTDLLVAWLVGVAAHHSEGGQPLHPCLKYLRLPLFSLLPSLGTVAYLEDSSGMGGGQVLGGGRQRLAQRVKRFPVAVAGLLAKVCPRALAARYVPSHLSAPVAPAALKASGGGSKQGGGSRQNFALFGGRGNTLGGSNLV